MAEVLSGNMATDANGATPRHTETNSQRFLGICLGVRYSMTLTVNTCECRINWQSQA